MERRALWLNPGDNPSPPTKDRSARLADAYIYKKSKFTPHMDGKGIEMAKTGMSKGRPNAIVMSNNMEPRIIPTAPEDLNSEGRGFWIRTFSNAQWLDSELDFYSVYLAAKLVDDIAEARIEISKSGRYQVLPNGVTARSAALVDLEHLHTSLNSYLAALGLTPTDRAKLGIEPKQETDALAELARRRLVRENQYRGQQ